MQFIKIHLPNTEEPLTKEDIKVERVRKAKRKEKLKVKRGKIRGV
jgi:hypothetical protein